MRMSCAPSVDRARCASVHTRHSRLWSCRVRLRTHACIQQLHPHIHPTHKPTTTYLCPTGARRLAAVVAPQRLVSLRRDGATHQRSTLHAEPRGCTAKAARRRPSIARRISNFHTADTTPYAAAAVLHPPSPRPTSTQTSSGRVRRQTPRATRQRRQACATPHPAAALDDTA